MRAGARLRRTPGRLQMSGGLYRSANASAGRRRCRPTDGATVHLRRAAEPAGGGGHRAAAGAGRARRSAAANSAVMAVGSLVSRGTGFLRNAGDRRRARRRLIGDAYTTAQILPGHGLRVPARRRAHQRAGAGAGAPPQGRRRTGGEAYTQRLLTLAVLALGRRRAAGGGRRPAADRAATPAATTTPTTRTWSPRCRYLMLPMIFFTGLSALIARCSTPAGTSPPRCGRRS